MTEDASTATMSRVRLDEPKPWQVVLHNDDFTPMDFVTELLMHVFGKSLVEAEALMLTVHNAGKAVIGTYSKEVAVSKATLAVSTAEKMGHPLLATAEQA